MSDSPLARKLLVKPGTQILALNAPGDYLGKLEPLPQGASLGEQAGTGFDQVHLFVGGAADLRRDAGTALAALKPGGLLWACYPKGGRADINRDRGWEPLWDQGWQAVTQVAIDDTWSALRFRPNEEIGSSSPRAV